MRQLVKAVIELIPMIGPRTRRTVKVIAVGLAVILAVYLPLVHYLELHQAGLGWNWVTGEVWLTQGGIHFSSPAMMVARIDTRPKRVCVTSTTRAVNCRLVQFDLDHFQEFLKTEGFRYYWWSNRLSVNFGYDDEYRGWKDVLRGYGFSVKHYSFIKVLKEYQE